LEPEDVVAELAKEIGILRGVGSSGLGGRRVLLLDEIEDWGGVDVIRATWSWRVGWFSDDEDVEEWSCPYIIISDVSGPSVVECKYLGYVR
jgi:hypothetical protein